MSNRQIHQAIQKTLKQELPTDLDTAHQLIHELLDVVSSLEAKLSCFEEQYGTSSRNSSKPPSSDTPKQGAHSMFKGLLDKASNATKNIALKSSMRDAQKSVDSMIQGAKSNKDAILGKHWSKIEKLLYERLIVVAENKLHDDKSLELIFEKAYEVMPAPVRLILSRDRFVLFCLERKDMILEKLLLYKKNNSSGDSNSEELPDDSFLDQESIYSSLIPELIALCITADGEIEESEIELATAMIENDEFIEDKENALESLALNIDRLISDRKKSSAIFKMKSSSIISKIEKINNNKEREKVNTIVEHMLSSVSTSGIEQTQVITDSITKKTQDIED